MWEREAMSELRKCDRCDAVSVPSVVMGETLTEQVKSPEGWGKVGMKLKPEEYRSIDLCGPCTESLKRWLEQPSARVSMHVIGGKNGGERGVT